jgi:hypothetical protein
MKTKPKDDKLGPILKIINFYIRGEYLSLLVDHSTTDTEIIHRESPETTRNAFFYIVNQFIKTNKIDFKLSGFFEGHTTNKGYWEYFFKGSKIDPIEYFIDTLK